MDAAETDCYCTISISGRGPMKGKIQFALSLLLYTEYSTGRGGTLETHPVYECAATTQPVTPRPPAGS